MNIPDQVIKVFGIAGDNFLVNAEDQLKLGVDEVSFPLQVRESTPYEISKAIKQIPKMLSNHPIYYSRIRSEIKPEGVANRIYDKSPCYYLVIKKRGLLGRLWND